MRSDPTFEFRSFNLFRSLTSLMTPIGIQASNDELYKGAIFGRDSLRVGLDLVPWLRSVAELVLFSLARLQATEVSIVADAKRPGQIPHEARFEFIGGRKVPKRQLEILRDLAQKWGGSDSEVVQFGSADATPQFVRLAADFCHIYGTDILDEEFVHANGAIRTLRASVEAAVRWTEEEIRQSDRPLLGFVRSNQEYGHRWQILQDGAISVLHLDGRIANADARIETIGLQGLAYDCLVDGAELLETTVPTDARRWRDLAHQVQHGALQDFWLSDEQYFAMAIDRDPANGSRRIVGTLSAMPTELLETRIFDTLPMNLRRKYVSSIVRMAHGPDFLTNAGIRSRALRHSQLVPVWDYHGSHTCWGVTNNVYALGLRRQGFDSLARDIECRQINSLQIAGALYEFLYVGSDGNVISDLVAESEEAKGRIIYATNRPERTQAWTVSFALRVLLDRELPTKESPFPVDWQNELARDIAVHVPLQHHVLTHDEVVQARNAPIRPYYLDVKEARRREAKISGEA